MGLRPGNWRISWKIPSKVEVANTWPSIGYANAVYLLIYPWYISLESLIVMFVTVQEYARQQAISVQTVKRRLKAGTLQGYQSDGANGRWYVAIEAINAPDISGAQAFDADVSSRVRELEEQLGAAVQTIRVQNDLIYQLTPRALPAPTESSWWRRLFMKVA